MKVKLSELHPNPFKKDINGGRLNPTRVEMLKESIKKDGFWDNVMCRSVNGHYELAYGHHRLAAAKEILGNNHTVDIPCRNFSDEKMLRIMANENSFQNEEYVIYQIDTVVATKKWLERCPPSGHRTGRGDRGLQGIGSRQISEFLGEKNWSKTKIADLIKMHTNLHPDIQQELRNAPNMGGKYVGISKTHGILLSQLPKEKQSEILRKIKTNNLSKRETEVIVDEALGKYEQFKKPDVKTGLENVIKMVEVKEFIILCKKTANLAKKISLFKLNNKGKALLVTFCKELVRILQTIIKQGEQKCLDAELCQK